MTLAAALGPELDDDSTKTVSRSIALGERAVGTRFNEAGQRDENGFFPIALVHTYTLSL